MEKLSVIITTINDAIATNFTIAQLIHQLELDSIDYEIIVVDNVSDEDEKKILDSFLKAHETFPIRYYEYEIKGTIPPHSFGAVKAIGKYITMPDPHMVFSPHYYKKMIALLKKLKPKGVEIIFSVFSVGTMARKEEGYISGSPLSIPNPFGRSNGIGDWCKRDEKPHPVLSNTISGMVLTKKWLMETGN